MKLYTYRVVDDVPYCGVMETANGVCVSIEMSAPDPGAELNAVFTSLESQVSSLLRKLDPSAFVNSEIVTPSIDDIVRGAENAKEARKGVKT